MGSLQGSARQPNAFQPFICSQRRIRETNLNLVDPNLFQARHQPAGPALLTPGACLNLVSYEHLGLIIHNVARRARSCGLERGHVVALSMRDPLP